MPATTERDEPAQRETGFGRGEIDTALRPNGNSGPPAVSLDALNQLPAAAPVPTANKPVAEVAPIPASPVPEQPGVQQELQATKDVVVKQAQELQQLKAELESVRRQLAEKESAAPKTKPKPAPRKTAPTP